MKRFIDKSFFLKLTFLTGISIASLQMQAQSSNENSDAAMDSTATAKLAEYKKKKEIKPVKYSLRERFAFRANMVDWVLATPSVGVQFDLSPWDYNKMTIGANIKYNPGANQSFDASLDYKMLDARVEFRKYFRESLTIKAGQKRMPKYWRAYYWGAYASYTDYTVYFKKGYTGRQVGLGATAGWEIPLISMKNGGIDLDLGASIGWVYGENKKRIEENGTYKFVNEKEWHIIPYPIVSELKVALVYRFKTVKVKYNKSKQK